MSWNTKQNIMIFFCNIGPCEIRAFKSNRERVSFSDTFRPSNLNTIWFR